MYTYTKHTHYICTLIAYMLCTLSAHTPYKYTLHILCITCMCYTCTYTIHILYPLPYSTLPLIHHLNPTAGYGGGGVAGGLFIKVGQDTVPSVALAGLHEQRVYAYCTSYQEEISLLLRCVHIYTIYVLWYSIWLYHTCNIIYTATTVYIYIHPLFSIHPFTDLSPT